MNHTLEDENELRQQCFALLNSTQMQIEGLYCRGLFDGWSCWPDTPAGKDASQPCPTFIMGFDPNRTAYRRCEEDGQWFFHVEYNKTWSNYTTCVNIDDLVFRQMIIFIHSGGYLISLVALLISLGIFSYFKSLKCARISIHMNLFASFAINNFLWLLWYIFVLGNVEILGNNPLWCRMIHIILTYFLLTNYSWMLCEGLYLHTVLVSAFISETLLLRCMLVIGWGIPIFPTATYVAIRSIYGTEEEVSACWKDEVFLLILQVPVCIILTLNVLFLFNILRVLCIKLRRGPHADSGASRTSLQALRATLLLVPLLGLNFLITPFRPEEDLQWQYPYEIISAVVASLQGLCVAILFCFCNGEVMAQIKRKWTALGFRTRANSCTVTTVSFVRSSFPNAGEDKV